MALGSAILMLGSLRPVACSARAHSATPAAAPSAAALAMPEPCSPGILLGDELRYPTTWVGPRVAFDLAAIPANIPRWQLKDWGVFAAVTGATIALMWPTGPSPDVRIDRWIARKMDPWMPDLWRPTNQAILLGGLGLGGVVTWGVAHAQHKDALAEGISLVMESVAVAEVLHLVLKFLIGREGPGDGDGLGSVLGPSAAPRLYPAGTPSGHFASLYAVVGAAEAYWRPHWAVSTLIHLAVGAAALTNVINHRHYLSDIVAGGAMGYATGYWVVRHRASRYAAKRGSRTQLRVTFTGQGVGLQLRF